MTQPSGRDDARRLDRFGLLASAIARRTVDVAAAAPGDRPWTDGTTVFADAGASAADQVAALAVQASLIASGSLGPGVARRLSGRPALARRYLAVEGHRALAANAYLLPPRVRSLIDHDMAARSDSPLASLAIALGRKPVAGPPDAFGAIHPRRLLAARDRLQATASASGEASGPGPDARREARRELDPEDPASDDLGRLPEPFTSSTGGGGALGRLLQRMLTFSREPGSGLQGAEVPRAARLVAGEASGTSLATGPAGALEAVSAVRRQGRTYPEWDARRQRYRENWCTVREADPPPAESGSGMITAGPQLRRPLARLALGLERCHRQLQGDDLDIDAAVEERLEALAGLPPDEAVYIDSLRRRHDLAVLILLDISGSAAMPSPSGQTVHDQQCAAAAALTAALHGLGNRVALYGFYSRGRSAVDLLRVKRFGDRLDATATRRLAALVPGAYTRLGAAIRHGTAVLEGEGGTARRLLVVLSDGLAYDYGYEGGYAEADATRALAEARRRGTGCLCLSVGAGTEIAALRRVFGTAAHATVARPQDLAHVAGPLFREALRSAELQRRLGSRAARARQQPSPTRKATIR